MIKIFLLLTLVIGIWIIKNILKSKVDQKKIRIAFSEIFSKLEIISPTIIFSGHYGFPSFEVIFENEKDYKIAKNSSLFEEFHKFLDEFYKDGFDGKFCAGLAVDYTYPGKVYSFDGS